MNAGNALLKHKATVSQKKIQLLIAFILSEFVYRAFFVAKFFQIKICAFSHFFVEVFISFIVDIFSFIG